MSNEDMEKMYPVEGNNVVRDFCEGTCEAVCVSLADSGLPIDERRCIETCIVECVDTVLDPYAHTAIGRVSEYLNGLPEFIQR